MTTTPITGIHYLLNGFELIFKPGLKRFVIIPFLLNILLFVGLFLFAKHFFSSFNHWLHAHLPWWLHWIEGLLWITFFIGFFLLMAYLFVIVANLVCAPFNSLLAEKVEIYLSGNSLATQTGALQGSILDSSISSCIDLENVSQSKKLDVQASTPTLFFNRNISISCNLSARIQNTSLKSSLWEFLKDMPRMIGRQLAIIAYYLPRALLLLILFFIPIIQLIAALLWFAFHAWMMSIQYLDYPSDNNRISFAKLREYIQQKPGLILGFGSSILVITMIPILNFIVIPAAVAGATKLWVKEYKNHPL